MSAVAEETTHPVAASAGGNNACLVKCKVYNASRHYAVCLKIIGQHEAGMASVNDGPCNERLDEGMGCPAYDMRAKEIAAGKALFFQPREINKNLIFSPSYERGFRLQAPWPPTQKSSSHAPASVVRAAPVQEREEAVARVAPAPVKKATPVTSGNDYADLVNTMMKEETEAKAQPVRTGLLDTVRKMREAK